MISKSKRRTNDEIHENMERAAQLQNYESAAYWRDKLEAIDRSTSNQNVLLNGNDNKDIIGYYTDKEQKFVALIIIHVRDGKI